MPDLTDPWPAWWVASPCPACEVDAGKRCMARRWVAQRPCDERPIEDPGPFDADELLAALVEAGEPLSSNRLALRVGVGNVKGWALGGVHQRGGLRASGPRNWRWMMNMLTALRADDKVAKLPHEFAKNGATYYALKPGETRVEVQRVATEATLKAAERAAAVKSRGLVDMLDGLRRRS